MKRLRLCGLVLLCASGLILPLHAADKAPAKPVTAASKEKDGVGSDTGLPVPRFVSLKSAKINVRRGPGNDNQITWVFKRKGLPVEIIAESGRWRKIRDHDGATGWVWHAMLDGRRSAIVMGKPDTASKIADAVPLFTEPSEKSKVVAFAEVGVIARLPFCQDLWCELEVNGYEGWVLRSEIWGAYPHENFE
jgi:SH3-like domain-containing protein